MVDDHDSATWHQTIVNCARVPGPNVLALNFASRIRHAAERVINQEHVCAAPHHGGIHAYSVIGSALCGVPTAFGLAIFGKASVKQPRVFRAGDNVANIARKVLRQRPRGRSGDELSLRVPTEIKSGKSTRCELGFAVSRWDKEHESVDLAELDAF